MQHYPTLPPRSIVFAFFLPLGRKPVPVDVTHLSTVSELAREAVAELALPAKIGRAVTAADVNIFVISREDALQIVAGGAASAHGAALGALDPLDFSRLCKNCSLMLELEGERRSEALCQTATPSSTPTVSETPSATPSQTQPPSPSNIPPAAAPRACRADIAMAFAGNANVQLPHYQDGAYLRRSACLPGADSTQWRSVAAHILSSPRILLLALGGSLTAGVLCDEGGRAFKECSWPVRLLHALQAHFVGTEFELLNLAAGATTTVSALPSLAQWLRHEELMPGLVFLDFGVNDGLEADAKALPAAMEQMLLTVRRMRPNLLPIFTCTCGNPNCAGARELAKRTALWHGVPAVAFFPDYVESLGVYLGAEVGAYWTHFSHPPWPVHQAIADIVATCIVGGFSALCGPDTVTAESAGGTGSPPVAAAPATLSLPANMRAIDMCDVPATAFFSAAAMEAAAASPSNASASGGNSTAEIVQSGWPLAEDRKGKPGWISDSPTASISFRVTFGTSPRLVLTYLRSYEGLARATMQFDDVPGRVVQLDGLHSAGSMARVSQAAMVVMDVSHPVFQGDDLELSGVLGFGILPFSTHTVTFRVVPRDSINKFKIISLTAC